MFDSQLARIRALLEIRSATLHRRATQQQIEDFEKRIGLLLPDQFREFLLEVGDGADVKDYLQLEPICPENRVQIATPAGNSNGWRLVIFPLRDVLLSDGEHWDLEGWDQLSAHEKMESNVALQFAEGWWDFSFAIVLRGAYRGRIYSGSLYSYSASLYPDCSKNKRYVFDELLFLDWLEKMLMEKEQLCS